MRICLRLGQPAPLAQFCIGVDTFALRGVFCHHQNFSSQHLNRTSIAQRRVTNSQATDDDAIGELRPIATAAHIRVAAPYVKHTGPVRAEHRVVVGEDFFCHGRRSVRLMPSQIEG